MYSDEYYEKITFPFYIQRGYSELEKKVFSEMVLSLWMDDEGEKVVCVTLVKKDYINDSDISSIDKEVDIELFSNSYYRGERKVFEIINRKNLWKVYQEFNRNN